MGRYFIGLNWVPVFLSLCLFFLEACEEKQMEKAYDFYRQNKHQEAMKIYRQALTGDRDSVLLNYNAGVTLYRLKNYAEAVERFNLSLVSEDRALEAKASYNIGNCRFRQGGLSEETDPAKAIELYKDAQAFYKRSVELNPRDEDAVYNHNLTGNKIRVLQARLNALPGRETEGIRKDEKPPVAESVPLSALADSRKVELPLPQEKMKEGKPGRDEKAPFQTPGAKEMMVLSKEEAVKLLDEYRLEEESLRGLKKSATRRVPQNLKDW
jgi:tetratricopeptide (TPR) repeat protein